MVELTRWLFERFCLTYHEEAHAPILHVLATKRRGGGDEVPVVVAPDGIWDGARAVLENLDARSRPGDRLLGETEVDRSTNNALIESLLSRLLTTVRRFVYFHMLPFKKTLYPIAVEGAPAWERGFVFLCYPVWRRLMGRGLGFDAALLDEAPRLIQEACDIVENELQRRQSRFLGGDVPGGVDIVFAALMAPIVMPPGYGAKLPARSELPLALANFVAEIGGRRAGQLVLDTYKESRPTPQPAMPTRGSGRPLSALLQGPTLQRLAARIAAAYGSVLQIGRYALVSRWVDVQDVLRRDLDFLIAPVNGPRIEEVSGKFLLGLDRGDQMARERPQLYAAVSKIDLEAVRSLVAREAERLLDDAIALHGRIDVVNGYARLVAARTARLVFGIAGPTEMDLMRVARTVFHHTFLNLGNDQEARRRALSAAEELREWCMGEIAHRRAGKIDIDDMIGYLLKRRQAGDPTALDDDAIRRNVSGLLVGAIDTTASAVGKIITMAAADPALLKQMSRDLDDPDRMIGWCNELLRWWTHNPILLREAATDVSLGGTTVRAGTTVVAFTQAAMFDPGRFVDPGRMDPDRAAGLYWHFGGGLHACAGRAVNDVQIPELVSRLLRRGIARTGQPRYDGPFVDELVVSLAGERS